MTEFIVIKTILQDELQWLKLMPQLMKLRQSNKDIRKIFNNVQNELKWQKKM